MATSESESEESDMGRLQGKSNHCSYNLARIPELASDLNPIGIYICILQ